MATQIKRKRNGITYVYEQTSTYDPEKKKEAYEKIRQQFTIYPDKDLLEQVKILSKLKDMNLNNMFLRLIDESLKNEEYQKLIQAYKQIKL